MLSLLGAGGALLHRVSDGGLFTSYKSVHKRVFDGGFSNLCPVPPVLPASHTGSSTYGAHGHHNHHHQQQQQGGAATHTCVQGSEAAVQGTQSGAGVQEAAGSSHAGSSAHAAAATSSTAGLPTAPASALLLHHRLDSTKGITTRLLYSKSRPKVTSGHAHKSHSYSRAASASHASTSHASTSHSYSRSASMPQPHHGSGNEVVHPPQYSSSSSSSWAPHPSSSSVAAGDSSTAAAGNSSSATAHSSAHAPQQGLWAQRRQRQQAEQLLVSSCEVTGPGSYVAAPDWCAVRVCVLPAKHMHEFPAMFRVSLSALPFAVE
jgi:hypothetical protein